MSIPREHRLRKHAEFEVVYRTGQRHFSKVLTAFYLLRPEVANDGSEAVEDEGAESGAKPASRVGITVGRPMGTSVVRNRIKRRVRAAVTQNIRRLTRPVDVVINPKKVAIDIQFQQLCAEVAHAFDVIEHKAVASDDPGSSEASRPVGPERLRARKH